MSVLRKSLDQIAVADLEALISSEARETAELEFKGSLPFVPTKGQLATSDRWIEKGDRLGDYARDHLLAEIVAFANADGGTLVIGLHETKDEPRRAESLNPLPNCEGLARRLIDAAEDVIEPRLPTIAARALPANNDGSGYIILRVGKSLAAPHRLATTREFYVRRGERTAKMTVREIKDHTLDSSRYADRFDAAFYERHTNASQHYSALLKQAQDKEHGIPPLVVRATAIPTTHQFIPNLTRRQQLWWKGKGFRLKVDDVEIDCSYPLRDCNHLPRTRLRALVSDVDITDDFISHLVKANGTVEFMIGHHLQQDSRGRTTPRVYLGWLAGLIVGVICQIEHLRKSLAWDAVEFGLEVEIWSAAPLCVSWTDRDLMSASLKDDLPITLPRYSLAPGTEFSDLLTQIFRDIFDACGSTWNQKCSVPWDSLTNEIEVST
jgi:hypothetical protein